MRSVFVKPRFGWASVLGILCIGLVLVSGMAQAAHFHAAGTIDHDCALCVAAHQAVHAAPAITLDLSSLAVACLPAVSRLVRPRSAVFFRLNSRPPPEGSALLA
jgi:hypothetical protein